MELQLDYGNWIRKKNLLILGLLTCGIGTLTLVSFGPIYQILMAILFVAMCISFMLPLYAYVVFSQKGGRLQEKIYNLILQRVQVKAQASVLDIGSGNGVLAIKLAQLQPNADVTGIDYWGQDWEYSKSVCEKNARVADVEGRVHFQKGDAAALPFPDGTFDAAISNLTFHEVKSVADKRAVLQEALRVVKPGGTFAFVDYFYDEQYYGRVPEFKKYLVGLKLTQFECKPIDYIIAIPALLRHPRALGRVGIIYGRK